MSDLFRKGADVGFIIVGAEIWMGRARLFVETKCDHFEDPSRLIYLFDGLKVPRNEINDTFALPHTYSPTLILGPLIEPP